MSDRNNENMKLIYQNLLISIQTSASPPPTMVTTGSPELYGMPVEDYARCVALAMGAIKKGETLAQFIKNGEYLRQQR